jgi:hypothetical protein
MNESTMTQLRILVERAVRPVRAAFTRKRKMREELLAHVSDVFEEESANVGEERIAVEQTAQRFGNAADLTKQLQAAVPAGDSIDRWLAGHPEEATLRAATRLAAWILALSVIVFTAATVLSGLITVWPKEAILFTASSILLLPVYVFGLTFATEWIRQALYEPARRSRFQATLLMVGWFAFNVALFQTLTWLSGTQPAAGDSTTRICLTLWLAVLVPWMPCILARVANARIRYHREWASLQID